MALLAPDSPLNPFPAFPLPEEEGISNCHFPDRLLLEFHRVPLTEGAGNWQLLEDFRFLCAIPGEHSMRAITAPKGMCTDLASVPKIFWSLLGPYGDHLRSAIIHDFLFMAWTDFYDQPERWMFRYANRVMYAGMEIDGVDDDDQLLIFNAVDSPIGWKIFAHKPTSLAERMEQWISSELVS